MSGRLKDLFSTCGADLARYLRERELGPVSPSVRFEDALRFLFRIDHSALLDPGLTDEEAQKIVGWPVRGVGVSRNPTNRWLCLCEQSPSLFSATCMFSLPQLEADPTGRIDLMRIGTEARVGHGLSVLKKQMQLCLESLCLVFSDYEKGAKIVPLLRGAHSLTELCLGSTPYDGVLFSCLKNLPALKHLSLHWVTYSTTNVRAAVSVLPQLSLESLDLSFFGNGNDIGYKINRELQNALSAEESAQLIAALPPTLTALLLTRLSRDAIGSVVRMLDRSQLSLYWIDVEAALPNCDDNVHRQFLADMHLQNFKHLQQHTAPSSPVVRDLTAKVLEKTVQAMC